MAIAAKKLGRAAIKSTDLASAATCDLGSVDTVKVRVTGSVGITSFGTGTNLWREVRFAAAPLLTNGANLLLPGRANIQAAAGDCLTAFSDDAGSWTVVDFAKANGLPPRPRLLRTTVITANGNYTPGTDALFIDGEVIGGGASGGSGARGDASASRGGGGAGAGGCVTEIPLTPVSALNTPCTVVVAAAVNGAAAQTVNSTAGNAGTDGNISSIQLSTDWIVAARGGLAGAAGTLVAAGVGGIGRTIGTQTEHQNCPGGAGGLGGPGAATAGVTGVKGPGGGGGGGGATTSAAQNGAAGRAGGLKNYASTPAASATGTGGTVGTPAGGDGFDAAAPRYAHGGGGGLGNHAGPGGDGGDGGDGGGGGGGGGSGFNGNNSGAGGDGGRGEIVIREWGF